MPGFFATKIQDREEITFPIFSPFVFEKEEGEKTQESAFFISFLPCSHEYKSKTLSLLKYKVHAHTV